MTNSGSVNAENVQAPLWMPVVPCPPYLVSDGEDLLTPDHMISGFALSRMLIKRTNELLPAAELRQNTEYGPYSLWNNDRLVVSSGFLPESDLEPFWETVQQQTPGILARPVTLAEAILFSKGRLGIKETALFRFLTERPEVRGVLFTVTEATQNIADFLTTFNKHFLINSRIISAGARIERAIIPEVAQRIVDGTYAATEWQ